MPHFDFTVNLPMLGGGAVFLFICGRYLGKIEQSLKGLPELIKNVALNSQDIARIKGSIGLD